MSKPTVAILLALATLGLGAARAQQIAPASAGAQAYVPSLADFMMMIQMRHAKVWLAGNARNWELADYQLDELKEGLEDAAKVHPTYKEMPVGQMIGAAIMGPVADLEANIKARDHTKFARAFDDLTTACNSCHEATKRAFIVIRRPAASSFPNQEFAPRKNQERIRP